MNSVCCSLVQNDWKNILKQREKASSVECKGSKSNKLINGSSLGLKIIMTVKELWIIRIKKQNIHLVLNYFEPISDKTQNKDY